MAASRKSRSKKSRHKAIGAGVRLAVLCIGIVVCLVLLCSCFSFDIGDRPSPYTHPSNDPAANWCGSMGAFAAFYLLYYIGPGVFVLLGSLLCYLLARLANRTVDQVVFRFVGMTLLTLAVSTTFYFFWPHKAYTFPLGSGGVLGVASAAFLRSHFAVLGTFILLSATWAVGLALLADSLIIGVLAACGIAVRRVIGVVVPAWSVAKEHSEALTEIWQRLSARQKSLALAGGGTSQTHDERLEEYIDEEADEDEGECEEEEEVEASQEAPAAAPVKRPLPMEVRRRAEKRQPSAFVQPSYDDYTLPPMELLAEPEYGYAAIQEKVVKAKASALEKLLSEFNINARVVAAETGPVVTMFELELAAGIKVSRITNLSNDIARALSAGAVRVVAPLPGKHTIGIEVPNSEKEKVRIKSLMDLGGTRAKKMEVPLFLGKDSSGEALVSDLTRMPHLLIAGTTGSGKSVCINSIIVSILLTKRPDEVKMILIDPKMVEMTAYSMVPHLMCPIVTETQMAVQILEWATVKMDERYALLAEARVKNIAEFNKLGTEEIIARFGPSTADEEAQIPKKLPYIMIVIDELADLMMTASKEIEGYIVRLAQKSRAVGIHIVLATQRPQATVVTGLIKSNMPCRIGFRVAARMDSRIILDQNGAETLLGEGDMLFLKPGTSDLIRAQGTFLDEMEIRGIIKHLKEVAQPQFHPELTQLKRVDAGEMPRDELFDEGVRVVLQSKRGSVSLLQRKLSVGYARASRMIEMMAVAGILGEYKGSQAREVLMTLEEYEAIRNQMDDDADAGYADLADEEEGEEHARAYASEGQQGYISSTVDDDD
ncbi:FtsK/SpoIIIE family DNA translocase [Anaerobaca lacustris]|uniref:DNA translocase FtsK 4TM domain-containing protein n=1 Tax=Anaerobaca lacustris TaxID=3044600 RepID=A0AAW6TUY3_9BACT|nr:DNA translocase FtsK 4TM domain-containing protein [Sedimentisphaerales bacterium M17dextr]